jgi:pyruvate formate lyase activating enzyme
MNHSEPTGLVLEIQRMSTEDGPGIRTTVFFKGCPLRCAWCHNPESLSRKPQVQWIGSRCIGCRTCEETCPQDAVSFTPDGIVIDRNACTGCGLCSEECPSTAMELLGQKWPADALIEEVVKDRVFFEKSGGGVTVSGGEPTLQAPFVALFLKGLKARGIQTALDTCGLCPTETLEMLLPYANIVLFDMKLIEAARHRDLTGSDNALILENLKFVADYVRTHLYPQTLWVRTPIIPGATATNANIEGIGRFIAAHLGHAVERWELCTFNNLCADKYRRLGMTWNFRDAELITTDVIEELTAVAQKSGVDPQIVHWTGSTRLEAEAVTNVNTKGFTC